jgi:hypothetical protein
MNRILRKNKLKYFILGLIVILSFLDFSCTTDNSISIREHFDKIGIDLTSDFKVLNYKSSGLTDYILEFEIKTDPKAIDKIIQVIKMQPDFFSKDTVSKKDFIKMSNELIPYKDDIKYNWEFYKPTKESYEYYRITVDKKMNIIKFHYLEE